MKRIHVIAALLITIAACEKSDKLGPGTGTGGSLARFTIASEHLYVVDGNKLHTFSLQNAGKPSPIGALQLSMEGEVETIYPWKDRLFIGTVNAMHILSISNPAQPEYVGSAFHVRACDPVVANDHYAYVTVRTGTTCWGNTNALQVFDVKDNAQSPELKFTYNLSNPHGLGLYGNYLYVCDGTQGLVIFDISNGAAPVLLDTKTGYTFFDCIPINNLLIAMVENGMVLYDISDPAQPEFLAEILN